MVAPLGRRVELWHEKNEGHHVAAVVQATDGRSSLVLFWQQLAMNSTQQEVLRGMRYVHLSVHSVAGGKLLGKNEVDR